MLETTRRIKKLQAEKKIIEEKLFLEPNSTHLQNKLAFIKFSISTAKAQKEQALRNYQKQYKETKRKDKEYMKLKKQRENSGRARKVYYVETDNAHDKKFKNVAELLEHYAREPNARYYMVIKYSGNKIINGIKARQKELTQQDILMLE
jgi:hypothetical protein